MNSDIISLDRDKRRSKTLVEVRILISKDDHDTIKTLAEGAKMPVSEMVYYLSQRGFTSLIDEQSAAEQAEKDTSK